MSMRLREFLAESATSMSVEDFPFIMSMLPQPDMSDPKQAQHYTRFPERVPAREFGAAIERLNDALAAGKIYNVVYNDVKGDVNRRLEQIGRTLGDEFRKNDYDGLWSDLDEDQRRQKTYDLVPYGSDYSLHNAPRLYKKFSAMQQTPTIEKMTKFLEEAARISTAMASLKDKIVKGRLPRTEPLKGFQAPMASANATKQIETVFDEQLKTILDQYKAYLIQSWTQEAQIFLKNFVPGQVKYEVNMLFQEIADFKIDGRYEPVTDRYGRTYKASVSYFQSFSLKPDWKQTIIRMAEDQAKIVRMEYLSKNTRKLGHLIDSKGDFKEIKPLRIEMDGPVIVSDVMVYFQDGTHFRVRNKVITKMTQDRKLFNQFPTTFHDVVLANGNKLSIPSEEKLAQAFKAAKPATV